MLDDSVISDLLNVDSMQGDLFLRGRDTRKLAEVRASHCPPSNDGISLSDLPFNRHAQVRVTVMEHKDMIAKTLNAGDVEMGCNEIRRQKLRQTIDIARVNHFLEKAACQQLVL